MNSSTIGQWSVSEFREHDNKTSVLIRDCGYIGQLMDHHLLKDQAPRRYLSYRSCALN
jgi:hypothetical protein